VEAAKGNPLGYESIGKLILRFSLPAIASNLVNAVYNMVDQIFIGNGIGYGGIAATNVAMPFVTLTTAASLLIGVGGASNFNLSLGAGDRDRAEKIAGNGLVMMVLCGISLSVLSLVFLTPLLRAFGATDEIMSLAFDYTFIVALGFPFQIMTIGVCQLIRADGSPNWAMICMMSGAVFNLIFDPVFMFAFGWGIKGIAAATSLGQVLSSVLAFSYIFRGMKTVSLTKESFRLKVQNVRAICSLGVAGFFNQLAMACVTVILNNTLRYYGALSRYGSTVTLGAVGAISKINYFLIMFMVGIGQGCQPVYGFNYGARDYARVKKALKSAFISLMIIAFLFFCVFQLFPYQIARIFGEGSEDYFEFATRYLRIFMFMTFANGLQPLASNYFTATGRAKTGMIVSLTRQIVFLAPLFLIFPLFLGIDGVVYAGPVADSAAAILALYLLAKEMKQLDRLIAQPLPPATAPTSVGRG
jgi:Na+-driven multidrug efflux pump